jgi:hypothetical protein
MDDRDPAQVEQVLALAEVAGTAALPAAYMGQGVLDRGALAQPGTPVRGLLRGPQLDKQPLVRWICTLRLLALVVHWARSGQAAQTSAGNCTCRPG